MRGCKYDIECGIFIIIEEVKWLFFSVETEGSESNAVMREIMVSEVIKVVEQENFPDVPPSCPPSAGREQVMPC